MALMTVCSVLFMFMVATPAMSESYQIQERESIKQACKSCHSWREPVTNRRALGSPHTSLILHHGRNHGRTDLWCLDCHQTYQPEKLHGTDQEAEQDAPSLEHPDKSCAVCHGKQYWAWQQGAHGKRLSGWAEQRVIAGCSYCHRAHTPALPKIIPIPPPPTPAAGRVHD